MIILYHTNDRVDTAVTQEGIPLDSFTGDIVSVFFEVARAYPSSYIVWCHNDYKDIFDTTQIVSFLVHKNIMLSKGASDTQFFTEALHYVEESPFLKINSKITYPTWQMHSEAGAVHSHVLNQCNPKDFQDNSFTYFLNSLAKCCQSQGLFCYQLPPFKQSQTHSKKQGSSVELYKFVKQHYKVQWVMFLFVAQLIFDKKLSLLGLLSSLPNQKKRIGIKPIPPEPLQETVPTSVDVIIPTMGRKQYLYDVLKDFAKQTRLPNKIIIVEQSADKKASTALDYLTTESWPFQILHKFIHQTGACNARNIALSHTTADWVFFADDDNRFNKTVIEDALTYISAYHVNALTTSYLQKNEIKVFTQPKQWTTFGAGNSFVRGMLSRKLKFDKAYEHGYGEDADYGMQLRNLGVDILYHPDVDLLHLKAPVGGFRQKITHPWEEEKYQPKPSPTVMLFKLKHTTKKQLQGYKLRLFLRQLKRVPLVQKLSYRKVFKQQWNTSVKWANYLREQ